jgi:hypothetical protein
MNAASPFLSPSPFLITGEVLSIIADDDKADAYLVGVVKTALTWQVRFIPDDVAEDAQRALAILARRARDREPLPTREVRG